MNNTNWLDVFNSATTFGLLAAIAVSIWVLIFLLLKKDTRSKSRKR